MTNLFCYYGKDSEAKYQHSNSSFCDFQNGLKHQQFEPISSFSISLKLTLFFPGYYLSKVTSQILIMHVGVGPIRSGGLGKWNSKR